MMPSNTKTIHEFNRSAGELVRVSLTEYRGKRYIDFRIYFDGGQGGAADWKPSRKGLCLSVDLVDDLKEGLEKAEAEVRGKKELSGLEEKDEDNGQTEEEQFGACMNGGGLRGRIRMPRPRPPGKAGGKGPRMSEITCSTRPGMAFPARSWRDFQPLMDEAKKIVRQVLRKKQR